MAASHNERRLLPLHPCTLLRHSQELRLANDILLFELINNGTGNGLLVIRGECEDSRTRSRQTDAQQTWMRGGCDRG